MRYGLFSDVHGNLPAFESVIQAFRGLNIDRYFCGGDVVGYGANPRECIAAVKNLSAACIAGNHDWAVAGKLDISYFNPAAKAAIDWTKRNIESDDKTFLETLPLLCKNSDFVLVHATLHEPEQFHYLFDIDEAQKTFTVMDCQVCFVGHTHDAGVFVEKGGEVEYLSPSDFQIQEGNRYIVNLGSVGQPRDGDNRACWCLFDTEKKTISIKRVFYDIPEAQRRIRNAGLPEILASRLALGQ